MTSSPHLDAIREVLKPLSDIAYFPVVYGAEAVDEPVDQLLYVVTIFIALAACLVLGQIDSVPLRKTYSTTAGFLIGFYFYGLLWSLNVGYIFVNYLFMRCFERHLASNLMTWFSAIGLISASYYHFQVNMAKSGGWDIDLIFMMNFVKLHMMAVNYDNAAKLDDPVRGKLLTSRERYFAECLRERVHFMDFMHYFMFVGSSWTGMAHEYKFFNEFINRTGDYAKIPKDKLTIPALKRFMGTITSLVSIVFILKVFPFDYLLTEEWAARNFVVRALYLIGAIHQKVLTMFIGFTAQESYFIACGQGYSPAKKTTDKGGKVTEEPENFNTLKQINMRPILTQYSWVECVVGWNIQVHNWLKYYVMLRLMDRSKPRGEMQIGPMAITFIVSAAWHGIEVGFFVMFIGFAFMEYFIKMGEKTTIAVWITTNLPFAVYHPFKWFYQYLTASYLCISFVFLHFEKFNFVHANLYYFCHWALPLSCLIVTILPKVRRPRPAKEVGEKEKGDQKKTN